MQTTPADFYRRRNYLCIAPEALADISGGANPDGALSGLDGTPDTLAERVREIIIPHYPHGVRHRKISEKMRVSYTNVRQLCRVSIKRL